MSMALSRTSPRFWNRMARRYARSKISDVPAYERKLERTQMFMRPEMDVLEFGCGTGGTALRHAPFVRSYLATDYSQNMIDIARERRPADAPESLRFDVAAIEDLALEGRRFDMILGLSVLHLLPARQDVIAQVARMLSPGGFFVTSTVCLGDMAWPLRAFVAAGRMLRVFPPVTALTEETLRAELRAAGFEEVEHWRQGPTAAVFIVARKRV